VNFYKHHLGDYDGHTAHLSWDEDMAYTRLLRAYYRREAPIPAAEAYRLARAATSAHKRAVDAVLGEFFTKQEDGWHNKRADEEITAYQAQAETNRRIARQRTEQRTVNESYTNRPPNHKPDTRTKNQEPEKEKSKASARARETTIPDGFEISDRVKTWAAAKGFAQLDKYLEFFTGRMKANGKRYTDWDEAFMNCIREDWPQFRKATAPDYSDVIARIRD
jgi:uncharacterized protein YdaU (DUF1376 family)